MQRYFFPELNYYFSNYWLHNGIIKTDFLSIPDMGNYEPKIKNSILRLLFDNNYDELSYVYEFKKINLSTLPKLLRERIRFSISLKNIHIYETIEPYYSNEKYSIITVTERDIYLLDNLLQFRLGNSIDLSMYEYMELETDFQKLLYEYLEIHGNHNYSMIVDKKDLVSSDDNLLGQFFEIYVMNENFKKVLELEKE